MTLSVEVRLHDTCNRDLFITVYVYVTLIFFSYVNIDYLHFFRLLIVLPKSRPLLCTLKA